MTPFPSRRVFLGFFLTVVLVGFFTTAPSALSATPWHFALPDASWSVRISGQPLDLSWVFLVRVKMFLPEEFRAVALKTACRLVEKM